MIHLHAFTEADIDRLIAWMPTAEFLMQWAGPSYQFPLTQEQVMVSLALTEGDEPEVLMFKAVDEGGVVVGHIELLNIDRRNRLATMGRVLLAPEARGRGLGQALVRAALRVAFDDLGLHRVGLGVFDFNGPAIRCYERAGFRHEGTMRDYRRIGDGYWSLCMMSVLEDEWRTQAHGWGHISH